MCHDLSFTAATVEFITDLLPGINFSGQLGIDFCTTSHVLSMSNRKCLTIFSRDGQKQLAEFEWGLIANFMKTPDLIKKYRIQMANAKMEKIFQKNSAWYPIRHQRCLIAVDGIYEHREVKGWANKIPYYIKLRDSSHMLLPGFYNYAPTPNLETGELKGTFAIITGPANGKVKKIHNHGTNKHRMPRFMEPKQALRWVDEDLSDEEMKTFLEYEIPSDELDVWPVFMIRTTKERPDGREKFEKFEYENLPELGNDEPPEIQTALFS